MSFTAQLLGTHVRGSSRQCRLSSKCNFLFHRQTEVGHKCILRCIQEYIGRFDVTMNEPLLVHILQRIRDHDNDADKQPQIRTFRNHF